MHSALSHVMVQDCIARYGGTAPAINAGVAGVLENHLLQVPGRPG